jgi:hypothetical protein
MDMKISRSLILVACVLCLAVLPASAVIQEVTLKGTVSSLIPGQNAFTIENPSRYGCDYPASGEPLCTFTKIPTLTVTGTAPTSMAYSIFRTGDTAVATSLGGTGGTWIGLAKLYGPDAGEEYVTDLVGDPATIPTPFVGDYALKITTAPDCTACSGTTCAATSADVTVLSSGLLVMEKKLLPRQSFTYNGRNDGSSIAVTFVDGEASSAGCAGSRPGMSGPQPLSTFIVNIGTPLGYTPAVSPAATPAPVTPAGTAAPQTPLPTTKSPLPPVVAVCALCLAGLVVAGRR